MRRFLSYILISALMIPGGSVSLHAQALGLPPIGQMVGFSAAYQPVLLHGVILHPDDVGRLDFIIDPSQQGARHDELSYQRLLQYFLTAVTVPSTSFWVNLSPFEKDKIVAKELADTLVSRDLLAQDYLLKQLTASTLSPDSQLGKQFWKEIYALAMKEFGSTQIPVNTFYKVWIVPETAEIETDGKQARIASSRLKVMLEADYLAGQKNNVKEEFGSALVRKIIIPALTREVNEGSQFAPLRQIYRSLILGVWYKRQMKSCGMLNQYVDQVKVAGISQTQHGVNEAIYGRYIKSYKKGVVNMIKEDVDPITQQSVTRKYFSGGFQLDPGSVLREKPLRQKILGPRSMVQARLMLIRGDNSDEAMSVAQGQALDKRVETEDYKVIRSSFEGLVRKLNEKDRKRSSTVAPFVFNHHAISPFTDSRYGGREMIEILREWLKESSLLLNHLSLSTLSEDERDSALGDDLSKIVDFFATNGWMSSRDAEKVKKVYFDRPSSIRELNREYMSNSLVTVKQIAELMMKKNDTRLTENMPEDMRQRNDAEEIYYFKTKEAYQFADEEMFVYSRQVEQMYEILTRALQRMFQLTISAREDLGEGLSIDQITDGLVVDQDLTWYMVTADAPRQQISFSGDLKSHFESHPEFALRIFQEAVKRQISVSPEILDIMKKVFVDQGVDINSAVREEMIGLLSLNKPVASYLLQMNQVGLLKLIFPVFDQADRHYGSTGHLLTLSMHTLYLLRVLEQFPKHPDVGYDQAKAMWGRMNSDPGNTQSLLTLRLSILMHDMQKDEQYIDFGIPHHIGGANGLVPQVLGKFNLPNGALKNVQWLVWHHQTLNAMAAQTPSYVDFFYDDLLHLIHLASGDLTRDMFERLVLISIADGSSVDPMKSPFKKIDLINKLTQAMDEYFTADSLRERNLIIARWEKLAISQHVQLFNQRREDFVPESRWPKIESAFRDLPFEGKEELKDSVFSFLKIENNRQRIFEEYTTLFSFDYYRQLDSHQINKHILMLALLREARKTKQPLTVLPLTSKVKMGDFTFFEFFIGVSQDRLGILRDLTGILAALGLNGLEAKINTTSDGIVFDTIQGYFTQQVDINSLAEQLNSRSLGITFPSNLEHFLPALVKALLEGKIDLNDIYALKGVVTNFKRSDSTNDDKTTISFENVELSDRQQATELEYNTPDRNGLIFIVSKLLAQMQINIETAMPNVPQHLAKGNFYLTKREGDKIRPLNKAEKDEIRRRLKALLVQDTIKYEHVRDMAMARDTTVGGIDLNIETVLKDRVFLKQCAASSIDTSRFLGFQPMIIRVISGEVVDMNLMNTIAVDSN